VKTILVTGGAGFIGSNFVRHLYATYPDYRILVLDLLTYAGNVDNLPSEANGSRECRRVEFWYGDVRNASLAESLVKRSDIVVHFAAETHVTRSIFDNYHFFETDVLGTQTIANAVLRCADRVERFIHISTSEVYGTARSERMSEEHALMPLSPYASAKAGADRLVSSYFATYDIPAIIVRPFNNFGPLQHLEKAVPRFITSCLLNEPITIHGDGSAARDWIFVEDHCDLLERLVAADVERVVGKTFNVGTGRHRTVLEVANAVREAMGSTKLPVQFVGDRPGQVFRHTCDATRAREVLGWDPKTSFEEALEQTIRWYRDHETWWRPQMWLRKIPIVSASGKRELH